MNEELQATFDEMSELRANVNMEFDNIYKSIMQGNDLNMSVKSALVMISTMIDEYAEEYV